MLRVHSGMGGDTGKLGFLPRREMYFHAPNEGALYQLAGRFFVGRKAGKTNLRALPDDAEFSGIRPRTHKVRAAERRKKVIQRDHVGDVDGGELHAVTHTV